MENANAATARKQRRQKPRAGALQGAFYLGRGPRPPGRLLAVHGPVAVPAPERAGQQLPGELPRSLQHRELPAQMARRWGDDAIWTTR